MSPGLAATGHIGFLVHVRNASQQPCATTGYPGVSLLDAAGRPIEQAQRTLSGFLGGLKNGAAPPQLLLHPGDEATALVEGNDVANNGNCPTATAILFTLPDNTDSTRLKLSFRACPGVQVHPLLAGDTGTSK